MPQKGYTKRKNVWSEQDIIDAIKAWVEQFGEIPASTDWNPSDCRRSAQISAERSRRWMERSTRFELGEFPWPRTVQRVFGSWNAALKAAGFEPRTESISPRPPRDLPDAIDQIDALVQEARGVEDPRSLRLLLNEIAQVAMSTTPED